MASSGIQADAATALTHAARLLASEPGLAAAQAREILAALPAHPQATLILGTALRLGGRVGEAAAVLEPLADAHPHVAGVQLELGLVRAAAGDADGAIAALRVATALKPDLAPAWRALGDELRASGDAAGADAAYAQLIRASTTDVRLMAAATALCDDRLAVAERALRDHLKIAPTDVAAIRMLAEVAARIGRVADAETLLRRALELAPGFEAARHNLATLHYRENRHADALAELERLLAADPANPGYRNLQAACFARIGEYGRAIEVYDTVLAAHPNQPKVWMSYGHALKTVARTPESIDAYRRATALAPQFGEAWWSLANLKTFRFAAADLTMMRDQLARTDIGDEDRFHLHFALGKALEDSADYEASFAHYRDGNALRRAGIDYDADENAAHVARSKALFTRDFLAARAGLGCADPDPIFVVGLPRAGSTLIEQILASHSQVEGTHELPDIIAIARRLGERGAEDDSRRYPASLATLDAAELRALGRRYLDGTRIQRKTGRPFFIDKMPNNFAHAGLIRLILPNAKIVDARRHPLGGCFSAYKQHFARGQNFTYDLAELGRYYADYVELMAHVDAVAPGAVHRVFYERMIADPETQIRALLAHLDLPFEDGCLRWWETDRAVRTPSSEQVRQPIFSDAAEQWRHFERWLEPLKQALGPALDCYPAASPF